MWAYAIRHYADALNTLASIDFVEVHAENFFAQGGATQALLTALSEHYPVSIHGTALGLASLQPIPSHYLQQLKQFVSACAGLCWCRII